MDLRNGTQKEIVLSLVPDFCWVTPEDVKKMFYFQGYQSGNDRNIDSYMIEGFRIGVLVRRGQRGNYTYLRVRNLK